MNAFTWIILAALVAFYLLDTIAALLNLGTLGKTLPEEFKGVYDEDNYRKLQDYTATNTRFELLTSTFDLLVLAVFWFAGGFEYLDRTVRGLHWGPVVSGLVFFGALGFGKSLISLPFEIYHTFRIEQQFGFNKTTATTYIGDRIKGLLLAVLIGGPILAIVLALFQYGGPHAWLYSWTAAAAFMMLMAWLGPAVIMPLFNKFQPLEEGGLRRAIMEYSAANRFPLAGVFVMDGSKRSTKANAFFTGFGATKKIVLFDTLIANQTVDELVAVLAHEVGHFKLRHVIQHLAVAVLSIGLFLFAASLFITRPELHAAFGVRNVSVYCGLTLFMVIFSPLSRIVSIITGFQVRAHEFDADRFAVQTTGRSGPLISALKKLSQSNLSNLAPHPLTIILHHSHPPVLKRIEAMRMVASAA